MDIMQFITWLSRFAGIFFFFLLHKLKRFFFSTQCGWHAARECVCDQVQVSHKWHSLIPTVALVQTWGQHRQWIISISELFHVFNTWNHKLSITKKKHVICDTFCIWQYGGLATLVHLERLYMAFRQWRLRSTTYLTVLYPVGLLPHNRISKSIHRE